MNVYELEATLRLNTNEYEQALREAERRAGQLENALTDMDAAAGDAERELGDLADGLRDVGESARGAGEEADGLGAGLGNSSSGFEDAMLKANLLTTAIETGVKFVSQFAQAIWNMDEATEEYRVSQAKLTTAFQASGYSVSRAKKTYGELYTILGDTDRATEASQLLAKLATNAKDFSAWATIAAGVSGTFGDSLPVEGLIEAANETAKVGTVTGVLADALNWAGISEDEFNRQLAICSSTTERTALITTTLKNEYSAAADAFALNSAEILANRDAQLSLQEAQAGVGKEMSRLKTALQTYVSPAAEEALNIIERLSAKLADAAEGWVEIQNAARNPLPTTSIEAAEAELAKLNARYAELIELRKNPIKNANNIDAIEYEFINLGSKIEYAEKQLAGMREEMEETADTAEELDTAVETITATANGFTVTLEGTGLTAEEASTRLGNYTDAALNMFDRISTVSEISYEEAVANLEANIQATEDFSKNLESIAAVLPPQLAEMFAAGGPALYAGIVSMLAEANAGSDVGLTELNAKYTEAGDAAVAAFLASAGAMPTDSETPATIMAAAVENDTSMETAATGVVEKTADEMNTAVQSAGFDSAGKTAMSIFIAGMESMTGAAMSKAHSIASSVSGAMRIGGGGRYSAGGLDYVPYNGYPITAHAGEALLTAREADEWRSGKNSSGGGLTVIQNISTVPMTPVELAAASRAYLEQARWA